MKDKLPKKFLENMQTQLGADEFALFLKEYDKPFLKAIRFNQAKEIADFVINNLELNSKDKLKFANGYLIDNERKLGNHPYHHAGVFYIQEPSAMVPALSVEFEDDDICLDLCASPGGKSSQIAEKIPNGVLVSNEIITNRALILKENLIRLGFKNTIITSTTPENLTKIGAIFNKVFVDAPCSGEGIFRRDEKSIAEWYDGINLKNQTRQLEILDNASKLVANGGKLIYSTCTFSKLENEDVVEKFLAEHRDFKLAKITDLIVQNSSAGINDVGRRIYPHKNVGEGQYVAVFEKEYIENVVPPFQRSNLWKLKVREENIFKKWCNENLNAFDCEVKSHNDSIFACPNFDVNTREIFTLNYGVLLGKIEKERFVPNHNFFTAFGKNFKNQINLTFGDDNITKYLNGESLILENARNGYGVILVDGFVLGGVKISNDRANNLYPKHLRIKWLIANHFKSKRPINEVWTLQI